MPQADLIVPLVAGAGHQGMTRSDIGSAIDLEPDVLDELLAGLVRFGLLNVAWEDRGQVYRTPRLADRQV